MRIYNKALEFWKHAKKECEVNETMESFAIVFFLENGEVKAAYVNSSEPDQIKHFVRSIKTAVGVFFVTEAWVIDSHKVPAEDLDKIHKGKILVSDSKYVQERLVGVLETAEGLRSFSSPIVRTPVYGIKKLSDEDIIERPDEAFGNFTGLFQADVSAVYH